MTSRVETQPPLLSLSQELSALRATIVSSWPVVVPPRIGNSVPGPERKLALVFAVGFTAAVVATGVGVIVGTRIRLPVAVAVTAGVAVASVAEGVVVAATATGVVTAIVAVIATGVVTATVAVIGVGVASDAIRASVAIGRLAGAFSTRKLAIHWPLSSRYQFPLASWATTLTVWPPLISPTNGKEISGPPRKLAVTGTVLLSSAVGTLVAVTDVATVGVIVAATVGVTLAVGIMVGDAVGGMVGAAVGVTVAVAVATVGVIVVVTVVVAVSVATSVALGERMGRSAIIWTIAVCGSLKVIEIGNVTLG